MNKKLLVPLMFILLIAGNTIGVTLAARKDIKTARITVILPKASWDQTGIWVKQTKQFVSETGIQVDLIQLPKERIVERILADITLENGLYDVIELDSSWVAEFSAMGWLEPLNDSADKKFIESFVSCLTDAFRYKNQKGKEELLGIPWNNNTRFFYYNTMLLLKAGFKEPPKTWDEVVAQANVLKQQGICDYPIAECWNQDLTFTNSFLFYLYSFNGSYYDNNGKITINKPPALDAVKFMAGLVQNQQIIQPASFYLSETGVLDLFYQGLSAYCFQGPPDLLIHANDPKISKVTDQIEVAPRLPGESTTLTLPEALAIPKTSKNKIIAWRYIAYMISEAKEQERLKETNCLPLFNSVYKDKKLLTTYPYWEQFYRQLQKAKTLPQVEWYKELSLATIGPIRSCLLGLVKPEEATNEIAQFLTGKKVGEIVLIKE